MGWNDVMNNNEGGNGDKVEFLSLKEGITFVTPLQDVPFSRWSHWIPQANRSISCLGKGCPVCSLIKEAKANGEEPKYRSRKVHSIQVIERSTGEVKILEQGNGFFEDLYDLKEEEGEISTYDLKIKRKGKKLDTSYRIDAVKHEFSKSEIEEAKEKCINLEEYFAPPTKEQVVRLINGDDPKDVFGTSEDKEVVEEESKVVNEDDLPFELE